jgi:hypothetical protein
MINVLDILEVRHSRISGWLEFQLRVRWPNGRIEEIPFTYSPTDDAPLSVGLREKIIPKLDPATILPALETPVG